MKKIENIFEIQNKFDEISLKREDKKETVMRNEKTQEYFRQIKLDEINEKSKKIEEIK